ncbi:MAG TPA: hypothetical protein VJ917_04265 [Saprospiraceae bacterium]|nr:hypothetical protein [Saprospiraceae bacterium]
MYKVYPEKPGTLFSLFRRELELMNKDYNDFMNLETTIDSTLTVYTKSDTARVKIFFSNKVDNLIASEVFFRKELFNNESFDDYRGNSMFNTAMKYLFVFEEGQIDTVFKMVQQYE